MQNISNPNSISELKSLIDEHDVISFDIFDTLLLRAYAHPDHLFCHLELITEEDDFASKRTHAAGLAMARNPQREEVTFDQIYDVLGKRFINFKQQELALEKAALTANPEMLEAFNYAKSKGKKIIIISDMYLSGEFLEQVLQKEGFIGYEKLYVSSDINKTKRSGNLFTHALKELNILPEQMLHIGDNLQVDCEVANYLGISAYYYEKVIKKYLQQNPKAKIFYEKNKNSIAASIITGVNAIKSLTCDDNYWKNLGYECVGPIMYGYTEWIYKNLKKEGIKEALFTARDGYYPKIIFDLFKDNDIKSHYFYAPRTLYQNVRLRPSDSLCKDQGYFEVMKNILDFYKDQDPYLQANTPEIETIEEGNLFIQENHELYKGLAIKTIGEYLSYISSENITENKIALIEGQSFLLSAQILLSEFMRDKTIYAYYWRYLKSTSFDYPEFYCKAYETNPEAIRNWHFMEFILSAPEPPIKGVDKNTPIHYKISAGDQNDIRIKRHLQISNGVIEFAKDMQKYFHGEYTFIDDNLLLDLINILEEYPCPEDIKNLFEIKSESEQINSIYLPVFKNWPYPTNANK